MWINVWSEIGECFYYSLDRKNLNMPQTKPIVSVENVVASASVDQKMDLNEITRTFPDVEYHPDQFPGISF